MTAMMKALKRAKIETDELDPVIGEWKLKRISEYDKPVPEFVLRTAVDVKTLCPGAELWIEEMTLSRDPFLVASHGSATYYLEVWNEPGFKHERVV